MAFKTIHTKKDGKKYVYSVEAYWDKEKKAPRNRQVCLGRLDEETGEIIPSERKGRKTKRAVSDPDVTAKTLVIGPAAILEKVARDSGLEKTLKRSFPDIWQQILSLSFFLVQKGLPLSRCDIWSVSSKHPYGEPISSQYVSKLLSSINKDSQQKFISLWMKELGESGNFFYDITSVSSYSEQNEYVRFGYNRDKEKLPQINLALLFGQNSKLPAFFRRMPGSISDVSTLQTTVSSLDFIDQRKLTLIMDRGFYSKANLDALLQARYHFIIKIPRRVWIEELYDQFHDSIICSQNRLAIGENEVLYAVTKLHKWKGRRCYVHIYYNNVMAAEKINSFTLKLMAWKQELESDSPEVAHQWAYDKYFRVKETPKRGRQVIENDEAVQKAVSKYTGFSSIMTTKKMDATAALEIYRRKELVENSFDDIKNSLDMKRLRIHSSAAMDSRLFIQFIALIILSSVRNTKMEHTKLRHLTIREIMEAMEVISEVSFSGRYGKIVTEAAPIQRKIMDAFGVALKS